MMAASRNLVTTTGMSNLSSTVAPLQRIVSPVPLRQPEQNHSKKDTQ